MSSPRAGFVPALRDGVPRTVDPVREPRRGLRGTTSSMTDSDASVIEASIADPAAFAAIFDRHAASLHRFLARRVEPANADNLLGDVCRVAFERRTTFDTARDSARPWLYGIATNLIARHRRSEGRRMRAMAA